MALSIVTLLVMLLCSVWPDMGLLIPFAQKRIDAAQGASGATPSSEQLPQQQQKKYSDAERIGWLKRAIDREMKELADLKAKLTGPDTEFSKASEHFQNLDRQRADLRGQLKELQKSSKKSGQQELEQKLKQLEQKWESARDRFNLAIEEKKTIQEKISGVEQKIEADQRALDALLGNDNQQNVPAKQATPPASKQSTGDPKTAKEHQTVPDPNQAGKDQHKGKDESAAKNEDTVPSKESKGDDAKKEGEAQEPVNPELEKAKKEADARKSEAEKAKNVVSSIGERIEVIKKNINLENALLETAQKRAKHAEKEISELEAELNRKLMEDPAAAVDLQAALADAHKRQESAASAIETSQARLTGLNAHLKRLLQEQAKLTDVAEEKEQAAVAAQRAVLELQNPYTLQNFLQWLIDCGPRLLAIIALMVILHIIIRLSGRRLVHIIANSSKRGTKEDREKRAETLVGVFRNAASITILASGTIMILDTVGVPIVPLMGGAAVIGLAVAFGAQNLIRDYFAGFMILLENQYGINDVVQIGDISGQVERITLRMTVLRDLKGIVHFIPHGTIARVSNMTHGYSRALLEIRVAYKENIDEVMAEVLELAAAMRKDPIFGPRIIDNPEMLGVEDLGESAVIIRLVVKTRPLQQWGIRRELLRRVKNRFDELGIEIPYPHRAVFQRHDRVAPSSDKSSEQAA